MAWRALFRCRAMMALVSAARGHPAWEAAFAEKYGKPITRASKAEVLAFIDEVIADRERLKALESLWAPILKPSVFARASSTFVSSSYSSGGTTDRAMSSR